jgi:hypothetical protein
MRNSLYFVALLSISCLISSNHGLFSQEAPPQIESTQLQQTLITPVMETPIVPGKNLIYCSTFQIAWNMLQDSIIGDSIHLTGNPEVVRLLDKELSTVQDIDPDCYVAMVDTLTQLFLDRINRALQQKFGDNAPPEVVQPINPAALQILAYAYMFKSLQFPVQFDRFEYPMTFKQGDQYVSVNSFGVKAFSTGVHQDDIRGQVQIYFSKDEAQYVVGLKSESEADEIILSKVSKPGTLFEAIATTDYQVMALPPTTLTSSQSLMIPIFDFNIKHSFTNLIGKDFLNEGWTDWFISDAVQWIRFKMDEKGVILKSEAKIEMTLGMSQSFRFTPPFLVYLKRKDGKFPYFAMWVDNAELMSKFQQ